jgi:hypothetical protein
MSIATTSFPTDVVVQVEVRSINSPHEKLRVSVKLVTVALVWDVI